MSYHEAEYRVWDDNEMRPVKPIMAGSQEWKTSDEVVVMKSTGHTDSEGTEIFEGDIVEWSPSGSPPMGSCVVVRIATSERFGLRDRRGVVWDFERVAQNSDLRVCGNIYQHPELIAVAMAT